MAALDNDFVSPEASGKIREVPVKAATTLYGGGMVGIDASGWAIPAATSAVRVIGRAESQADNSAGANGDKNVRAELGTFRFDNDETNAVTKAHRGKRCYVVDDHTVSSSPTGTIPAGVVFDVDTDGVWVTFGNVPTASSLLDELGSTQGNVLYRGASAWAALATGTNGQVLKSAGAAANPAWGADNT